MNTHIPFLALFEEKTAFSVEVSGLYNEETQILERAEDVYNSPPTHVETETGGWGDTDTGND